MHKDVKPKKILFNSEGNIKLVDFGLSKWESLNSVEKLSGTPFYLAPEVLKGVKTAKSDIWSIGVIMYALLSGHLPFVSDSNETVFHKAIQGKFSFEHQIWEGVSKDAKDLIKKMINTNVLKRFTPHECLEHEWFSMKHDDIGRTQSTTDNNNFASSLKMIRSKTIMQNVAYKFVKKLLNRDDLEILHTKFVEAAGTSEEIPIFQFKQVIESFNKDFKKDEIDKLVKDILKTQEMTGKINYVDLLAELDNISEYNQDTKIWMTFNKF